MRTRLVALRRPRPRRAAQRRAHNPTSASPRRTVVVVCVSAPACDAGATVLAKGGNAVDAAVATAFALAVTHPSAGNIGGGGFMIVRTPSGDVTDVRLSREGAAQVDARRCTSAPTGSIVRSLTAAGYLAPGVPGTVRGLELAHKKFGKLPWKDVVAPSVALAGRLHDVGRPGAQPQPRSRRARWLRFPRRSPPSASPAAASGRRAIGCVQATWRRRSRRSPKAAPTRSTRDGSPTASPRT